MLGGQDGALGHAPGKRPPKPLPRPVESGHGGGTLIDDFLGCLWPSAIVLLVAVVLVWTLVSG